MPTAEDIHDGLVAIANDWIIAAILWHVAIAAALVAVALGWRPTRRMAATLIAGLPASAAAFALTYWNPFNGLVLAATAAVLFALALGESTERVARTRAWTWWGGVAMVAFGWAYPHFLLGSTTAYLYAAPVGLVPCPTLSIAIGLSLLAGVGGPAWRLTLAGVGGFYAAFGALRLGVPLDLGLLAGSAMLAATAVARTAGHTRRLVERLSAVNLRDQTRGRA